MVWSLAAALPTWGLPSQLLGKLPVSRGAEQGRLLQDYKMKMKQDGGTCD